MGRRNCGRASWNLFARATAAFLAWMADQSRAACAAPPVGDGVPAGKLVFSTAMACELRQRSRDHPSSNVDSATLDHWNMSHQFPGRSNMALRRMQ